MEILDKVYGDFQNALLNVDRIQANQIFESYFQLDGRFESIEKLAIDSLEKIGQGWEEGNISLSQVYMSGVICEELMDKFLPKTKKERIGVPKMAIAVLQDYHSLGKRIVYSVLRAGGFEIMDFGHGLSVDDLVERTLSNKIEILLISTLMLPSALKVKLVKEKLSIAGSNVKIVVGGAPFRLDTELWKNVNADEDGKNATDIIGIIERMVSVQ